MATALIGSVLVVAACGSQRVQVNRSAGTPTTFLLSPPRGVGQAVDATIGQSVTTTQGDVVTVHAFQSPVSFAEAGFVIAAADVEACAPAKSPPSTLVRPGVSPLLFVLQLSDGTVLETTAVGMKQPVLPQEALAPAQCARGWVSFKVPEQQKAAYVVLRSASVVRWRVPQSG
jgi:hypothetical protein